MRGGWIASWPSSGAYADDVVRTKKDRNGVTISSVSAPWRQAMTLEQAGLRPGMRCLEIGSGGYNAALMAEIAGPDGEVATVDIDSDVTSRARRFLDAAGYPAGERGPGGRRARRP
jgi:protein-L-isoaspartate(D-aspartate) O-methyltransferase